MRIHSIKLATTLLVLTSVSLMAAEGEHPRSIDYPDYPPPR